MPRGQRALVADADGLGVRAGRLHPREVEATVEHRQAGREDHPVGTDRCRGRSAAAAAPRARRPARRRAPGCARTPPARRRRARGRGRAGRARVELRLVGEGDGLGHREGQVEVGVQRGGQARRTQRLGLRADRPCPRARATRRREGGRGCALVAAVDPGGPLGDPVEARPVRREVGVDDLLRVAPREGGRAGALQHGDLGGGVPAGHRTDVARLEDRDRQAGPVHRDGGGETGDPGARPRRRRRGARRGAPGRRRPRRRRGPARPSGGGPGASGRWRAWVGVPPADAPQTGRRRREDPLALPVRRFPSRRGGPGAVGGTMERVGRVVMRYPGAPGRVGWQQAAWEAEVPHARGSGRARHARRLRRGVRAVRGRDLHRLRHPGLPRPVERGPPARPDDLRRVRLRPRRPPPLLGPQPRRLAADRARPPQRGPPAPSPPCSAPGSSPTSSPRTSTGSTRPAAPATSSSSTARSPAWCAWAAPRRTTGPRAGAGSPRSTGRSTRTSPRCAPPRSTPTATPSSRPGSSTGSP